MSEIKNISPFCNTSLGFMGHWLWEETISVTLTQRTTYRFYSSGENWFEPRKFCLNVVWLIFSPQIIYLVINIQKLIFQHLIFSKHSSFSLSYSLRVLSFLYCLSHFKLQFLFLVTSCVFFLEWQIDICSLIWFIFLFPFQQIMPNLRLLWSSLFLTFESYLPLSLGLCLQSLVAFWQLVEDVFNFCFLFACFLFILCNHLLFLLFFKKLKKNLRKPSCLLLLSC